MKSGTILGPVSSTKSSGSFKSGTVLGKATYVPSQPKKKTSFIDNVGSSYNKMIESGADALGKYADTYAINVSNKQKEIDEILKKLKSKEYKKYEEAYRQDTLHAFKPQTPVQQNTGTFPYIEKQPINNDYLVKLPKELSPESKKYKQLLNELHTKQKELLLEKQPVLKALNSAGKYAVDYGTAAIKEPTYALAGLGKGFKNKVESVNSLVDEQVGLRLKDVFSDKTYEELLKEYREEKNKTPEEIYQDQLIYFKKEADKGNKSAKIVYNQLLETGKPLGFGKAPIENMKEYKNIEAGNLTETQEMASGGGQAAGGLLPTVLATAVNPYLGKAVFFGGAQYDYAQEALARGKTENEAQTFGLVMATIETLTEKLGFKTGVSGGVKELVKSGTSELVQEGLMPTFEAITNKIMFNENIEDVPAYIKESFQQGIAGLFLGFIMDGARSNIASAVGVQAKLDNGEVVTQAEIDKAVTDIKKQTGKDFNLESETAIQELINDLVKKGELTPKTTIEDIIKPQPKIDLTKPKIDDTATIVDIETKKINNQIAELTSEKQKYEKLGNYELVEETNIKLDELTSKLETLNTEAATEAKIIKLTNSNTYKSLNNMVEKLGFKLVLDKNIKKGQINMNTKEISLNPFNPTIFKVAAHEFVHIFDVTSNEYKKLLDIAKNLYTKQGKLEGLVNDIKKEHGYTNETDIDNEILAYFTEYNLFKDSSSIETLFNSDRNSFNTLHKIIKKFKDIFNKEPISELSHIKKQLNDAEKLYSNILKKSLTTPKKVLKTEPKLPIKEVTKPEVKKEIPKQKVKPSITKQTEQVPIVKEKKAPQSVIQQAKPIKTPIIKELSKKIEARPLQGREAIAAKEKADKKARNQALLTKGKIIDVNNQPVVVKDAEKGFSKMDFSTKKKSSKDITIEQLKQKYNENKKLSKPDADLYAELNVEQVVKKDIVKFSIGSEFAKLDNNTNLQLNIAKEMEIRGSTPNQIWYATGWQRNKFDNIWRFELPDGELISNYSKNGTYTLDEIYIAPELYAAYPDLKNVAVTFKNLKNNLLPGIYSPSKKLITLNNMFDKKSHFITLVHEVQHAIQDIDGLPNGGNMAILEAMYNKLNSTFPDKIINDKFKLKNKNEIDFYDIYKSLAGELEARNVQTRLKPGLKDLPLSATQDNVKKIYTLDKLYKQLDSNFNITKAEIIEEAKNIKYSKEIQAVIDYDVKSRKDVMKDLETNLKLDTINFDNIKKDKYHAWTHPYKVAELIFQPKEAAYINTRVIEPTLKNEAKKVRFMEKEKKEIDSWGIKKKSKEAAAIQKYGEGEYLNANKEIVKYTKEDLIKEFPTKYNKLIEIDKQIRNKYNMYLNAINEVRAKYGYEPINTRANYYKHFREIDGFTKIFGITNLLNEPKINTALAAHESQMKKNIQFIPAQLQRKGVYTTYDAITGIDKYINEISGLLFHTEDIQNIRYLANHIGSIYGETMLRELGEGKTKTIHSDHLSKYVTYLHDYADSIAGKQNTFDKETEKLASGKVYNSMLWLKRQIGSNLTALKLTSAATNVIPAVQTAAMSDQKAAARALFDTLTNIMVNDGFEQSNDFLTIRTAQNDILWDKMSYTKLQKFGQIFMETSDVLVANFVVRTRYYHYLNRGYSKEVASKKAGLDASKTIGGRSLVELPAAYKSKVMGIFNQFTLEPVNQVRVLTSDIMNKNYAAEDLVTVENVARYNNLQKAKVYMRLMAYTYLFGALFREIFGRDPTVNPIGTIERVYKHLNNQNLDDSEKSGLIVNEITRQIPFADIVTGGGKFPVLDILPDIQAIQRGTASWEDQITQFALHTIMPTGGGAINNVIKGVQAYTYDKPGVYSKNGKLKFPVKEDALSKFKNIILGPNTTKEAQAYYDNRFQPLTIKQTEFYFKSGLPINKYREYIMTINKMESDKYADGTTIEGTLIMKKLKYINSLPISDREKAVLLEYLKRR